jgi:hypothetical protein
MAVNDVLNQLQALIRSGAQQLIETGDQALKDVAPFVPGERYSAKVQEQIANGRFLVQVRDQTLDLNLPRNTQPGQTLELRFVSAAPRLTFVLADALHGPTPTPQTPVNLSAGARYLNALLDRVQTLAEAQKQPNKPQTQGALGLQQAQPVLAGAPPAGAQFAALLKDAVGKSGLFYESHQAQWAAGEKPLTELLREPQARLSEPRAFAGAPASPGQDIAQPLKAGAVQALASASLPESKASEPVHPQTAPLVQQQLDVLDTRQLVWQGQVWPGQDLRWQIEERAAQEGAAAVEREWQTRIDLHVPRLGEVNAVLNISPRGELRIALTAHSPQIAQALRDASVLLNQSLAGAGLQLAQLEVAGDA